MNAPQFYINSSERELPKLLARKLNALSTNGPPS